MGPVFRWLAEEEAVSEMWTFDEAKKHGKAIHEDGFLQIDLTTPGAWHYLAAYPDEDSPGDKVWMPVHESETREWPRTGWRPLNEQEA